MNKIRIHCPNCDGKLDVPPDAAGKAARCPVCKAVFRIKKESKSVDDDVADWLAVEEEDDNDIPPPPGTPADRAKGGQSTADVGSNEEATIDDLDLSIPNPTADDTMPYPASDRAAPAGAQEPGMLKPIKPRPPSEDQHEASGPGKTQPMPSAKAELDKAKASAASMIKKSTGSDAAHSPLLNVDIREVIQSTELKLYVLSVSTNGVNIGFNAHWMRNLPFRASMPFMCISCGERDTEKLLMRPLAWVDKSGGHAINPSEVESRYEQKLPSHQSAREIVRDMRMIEELPAPFKDPMPYYVCPRCQGNTTVHCEVFHTEKGIASEVLIPNGNYALQWLGRVNGVCGDDYLTLEEAVLKIQESGWRDLPENVRKRIAAWFDFKGNEQFITYLKDSDFTVSDSGLGGVVLTDKRIVYCKYHHHGEIPLDAEGHLTAENDGRSMVIKWQRDGKPRKTHVLLKPEDAAMLSALLDELEGGIQLPLET